jgi:hypothetical protein
MEEPSRPVHTLRTTTWILDSSVVRGAVRFGGALDGIMETRRSDILNGALALFGNPSGARQ